MQDIFVTNIHIGKVRHLRDVDISLSDSARKHLILTGKNGSGKTSLLEAMRNYIIIKQGLTSDKWDKDTRRKYVKNDVLIEPGIDIKFSVDFMEFINTVFIYIPANRSEHILPTSIEPIGIGEKTEITPNVSKDFLRYVLGLDYQLYGAKQENNTPLVDILEQWFNNFLIILREMYDCKELQLQRDTKNLKFNIIMPGHEPFGLHEMADGYTALLDIYMELVMRFEGIDAKVDYMIPAIVMVDEIETHLHVELQKRVLPFLTRVFPNVQFIVSTHSPFVISSLENAVVYDLERHEKLENPSFYSYETIVESFLGIDTYSIYIKSYFERYKELCFKKRSSEENDEFLRAKAELEIRSIPSTELYIAFQELEKRRKAVTNGTIE